jgi:hypothetical protein
LAAIKRRADIGRSLLMSDEIKSSEKNPAFAEKPKGLNYRAIIDSEKCTASGECIKIYEVEAIREGPNGSRDLLF